MNMILITLMNTEEWQWKWMKWIEMGKQKPKKTKIWRRRRTLWFNEIYLKGYFKCFAKKNRRPTSSSSSSFLFCHRKSMPSAFGFILKILSNPNRFQCWAFFKYLHETFLLLAFFLQWIIMNIKSLNVCFFLSFFGNIERIHTHDCILPKRKPRPMMMMIKYAWCLMLDDDEEVYTDLVIIIVARSLHASFRFRGLCWAFLFLLSNHLRFFYLFIVTINTGQ